MYGLSKGDPCARARAGFGITTEPTFSVSRLAYILAYGGVYAIAGIRCACIRHRMHARRERWNTDACMVAEPVVHTCHIKVPRVCTCRR